VIIRTSIGQQKQLAMVLIAFVIPLLAQAVAIQDANRSSSLPVLPLELIGHCHHHACMEYGSNDRDCCAAQEDGSCEEGYVYFVQDVCSTGSGSKGGDARRTCCIKGSKPLHQCEHSACMESGASDSDCCAAVEDQAGCSDGYTYYRQDICYAPTNAYFSCCVPNGEVPSFVAALAADDQPTSEADLIKFLGGAAFVALAVALVVGFRKRTVEMPAGYISLVPEGAA